MDARAPPHDGVGVGSAAGEVGGRSAGLGGDQHAGSEIPRVEVLLEVGVESAAGDHAEVERRRSVAAHVAHVGEQRSEPSAWRARVVGE